MAITDAAAALNRSTERPVPEFLKGGGEAGAVLRAYDWASSPLGPPHSWPLPLCFAAGLMLESREAISIMWGPQQITLYNDGYIPICGDKHPAGMGRPARELWAEIWDQVGPIIAKAMDGESLRFEDAPLALIGRGRDEPSYFSFSLAPLRAENGDVLGLFCVATETTGKIMAQRRSAAEADRWRRLFEEAPNVICILRGPDHVNEFVNATHRRVFGGDHAGKSMLDGLPSDEQENLRQILDRVYQTGERQVLSAHPVRFPGAREVRYLDLIYAPLMEGDGKVHGIFCEGVDVTDGHHAREALARNEEQLRLATDAAEVGLWDVDAPTSAFVWTPRVNTMFGISLDKPVAHEDFTNGLHPDDRERVLAAFEAAQDPNIRALYDQEYRVVGKEDRVCRWIAGKGRGIFDEQGRCLRVIGTAIDITKRKADEARLRELNETLERRVSEALAERKLLADIVEATDASVIVVDFDCRVLAINKAGADSYERGFGVRPKAGDLILDLLADHPEHQERTRAIWARAFTGEKFSVIEELGDPALERRWYGVKFDSVWDRDGRRIGAYVFADDVTERLREQKRLADAEAALQQTQKLDALGKLTGGVAHDFNNLLTPIIGGLDMLQRAHLGGEREQRLLAAALQSAERAKTLVQRLLAFARRQPLRAGAVDVASLVRGMADLIASTSGPQIDLLIDIPSDLPPAHADANQLEMAILNLSVNSRDAMAAGGTLRISAAAETVGADHPAGLAPGRYIRLTVADTGVGMDETVLERAIEPFFSTKGHGKGTGLGLSMAHGLASQLGGRLLISSRPGAGATVDLWLPQSEEPLPGAGQTRTVTGLKPAAGRVLLVDDEDLVRSSTAEMLADMGFEVIEARSGEEALAILEEGLKIDLLVTDQLMTGMTGVELAGTVRERIGDVRVLIISGFTEIDVLGSGLQRLNKPFHQSDLAAILAA